MPSTANVTFQRLCGRDWVDHSYAVFERTSDGPDLASMVADHIRYVQERNPYRLRGWVDPVDDPQKPEFYVYAW